MKKIFIILVFLGILVIGNYYLFFYNKDDKNDNTKEVEVTAGKYKLVSKPTKYQKKVFNELKDLVEAEEYDDEDLAECITKNFIAEFYTLSNVESRDVRGTQFVADDLKERFISFGQDIYNYYAYYTDKKSLEVKSIEITNTKAITYDYKDDLKKIPSKNDLKGYEITTNWSYKDNTNQKTVVTIVKWNEDYSIMKVNND